MNEKFLQQTERQIAKLAVEQTRVSDQIKSLREFIKSSRGNSRAGPVERDKPRAPKGKVARRVLELMRENTGPFFTSRGIADALRSPPGSVSGVLSKLKQSGAVVNNGAGKWTLAK